jgi:transposase
VNVLKVEFGKDGSVHIQLESTLNHARCRNCGQRLTKLHGDDEWVKVQHRPIRGQAVFLRYRPKRYECPDCDGKPTTTQQLSWHEAHSPHTKAYDEYLLRMLVNRTVQDVALKLNMLYESVWGVVERCVARQVDWSQDAQLGVVGVDEIARRKGHGDFIGIVSARLPDGHLAILGVLPDRTQETVSALFKSIPAPLQATITSVCTDLYEGYLQAVKEVLPHTRHGIDRFHVAQLYRDAADSLRKTELRRLKATLPPTQYKTLKGHLWAFRKVRADLSQDEHVLLERLFALSPALKNAYTLREQLTNIFDTAPSKNAAKRQLRQWEARVQAAGLACFDSFRATLHRHWNEITNYFVDLQTSGFVEGLNNKLKVLKRRGYGIFNLDHFFQLIFLDLEGYRLFA